jgi:16S rRNA (guanine527-N7)-methyltransferase
MTPGQQQKLSRYLDLLLEANQRMNLTSVTDRAKAELLHVGDALTLLPFLPAGEFTLGDIGSGGGCPGIPLAIVRPDARVMCIESTKKKAAFLREVAAALNLTNVCVEPVRAEDLTCSPAHPLTPPFAIVTARAVGSLAEVAALALPLLRPGGRLLAMKGPKIGQELSEAQKTIARLGGGKPVVHAVRLAGAEGHVVVEIVRRRR